MGQKITPPSLRINNNYTIIGAEKNYAFNFIIFKTLVYYFKKRGFIINNINFYKNDNILYVTLEFFISKNSKLYTKKYRNSLKRSKGKRFKLKTKSYLKNFLRTLTLICGVKKILFKAKRLEVKVKQKTATLLIANANKIGLHRYKKNKNIKDLVISLCVLIETGKIRSAVFTHIMSKHFSWLPKRQHKRFLTFIRDLFQLVLVLDKKNKNFLKGVKMVVAGRISGKTQSSIFQFIVGRIFTQSIDANIDFSKDISYSKLGTFGWKLWITKK